MELAKHYQPQDVEDKWYAHWMEQGYFRSVPDEREPYTILIPPPNVTGVLHMGHMLNNTIQDILIRKARQEGKNACWVPGMDHASIATEAKVVKWLREEKGINKGTVSRDEFMSYAWQWKEKYGGIILEQLKKLGASCDWDREAFTMDEVRSESVIKAFVDLYKKGKLYRDYRMVNWDPEALTVLSNEEVLYSNEQSNLYHVRYRIVGSDDFMTIATTRPETILADTALAVHPDDERYAHLKGKFVEVPLADRQIPIIFDDYVDQEFGTGALKITPAHDPNDYEIGKRHELEVIEILDDHGRMNETAGMFVGEDRMKARTLMAKALEDAGLLEKTEDYTNNVGRSERTNAVVEPKLSLQWYVDMKALAEPALKAVMEDEVDFVPKSQKNLYRHWMENIRDWCISRQLWWGHRIPAFYYEDHTFVAMSREEALTEAREVLSRPDLQADDLRQDDDVLDTWFSSWLWPISVFDGFRSREELSYYYPTSVLVTGWDIIFLWVARMVMAGYEWEDNRPFDKVYFTGMVRDKKGRKMSKSLGNSPDAMELIRKNGADSVRFGMLSSSPAGGDLLFDEKLIEQGRNFCNKMWNALRLIKSWETKKDPSQSQVDQLSVQWLEARFQKMIHSIHTSFTDFRLSEALMDLYNFIWNDFCSWYLELVKPAYGECIHHETYNQTVSFYEQIMATLHPFMPFITEEIWHQLKERSVREDCILAEYPKTQSIATDLLVQMDQVRTIVSKIREIRSSKQISPKEAISLHVNQESHWIFEDAWADILQLMANVTDLHFAKRFPDQAVTFLVDTTAFGVDLGDLIDVEAEKDKLRKDLSYAEGFLSSVKKKLANERFVQNAPAAVVEKERKKLKDGEERVRQIRESLAALDGIS